MIPHCLLLACWSPRTSMGKKRCLAGSATAWCVMSQQVSYLHDKLPGTAADGCIYLGVWMVRALYKWIFFLHPLPHPYRKNTKFNGKQYIAGVTVSSPLSTFASQQQQRQLGQTEPTPGLLCLLPQAHHSF